MSPSSSLLYWTKKNFGVQNITLLPNFILSAHDPSPDQAFNNTILFIGKLVEQKGVDVLMKAVAKVRNVFPDVRLTIVGEGAEELNLKELAANLQLSESIVWRGNLSNAQVMAEYDTVLCVVIPSKYVENCSVVGIEALAKGKVIIASNIGGLPDLVDDFQSGFLVRPDDPEDLSEKIIFVMQNRTMLSGMGVHAREKFLNTFSKEAYFRTLLSVYDRIIHEEGNRNP
jgi:glycosyltransferase involved in cell wall biosynthesis